MWLIIENMLTICNAARISIRYTTSMYNLSRELMIIDSAARTGQDQKYTFLLKRNCEIDFPHADTEKGQPKRLNGELMSKKKKTESK